MLPLKPIESVNFRKCVGLKLRVVLITHSILCTRLYTSEFELKTRFSSLNSPMSMDVCAKWCNRFYPKIITHI